MKTEEAKRLVKKANKLANPPRQLLPPGVEDRLKEMDPSTSLRLDSHWATHLSDEVNRWVFDLFRRNMKQL
jgi:hypothetical protein